MIDATAFCYRAFYAVQGLTTSSGQPTNAIYGFVVMLNKLLKNRKPDYAAVCFDVSRRTHRKEKFEEYKSNRPAMPDDLLGQMPHIKEIIRAYGITLFEKEGFEADDLIATLCRKARLKGMSTVVVSSDKDMLQLVDEAVELYNPAKGEDVVYSRGKIEERYGIPPSAMVDLIALMGDNADNIPGVPGIGEKTAVKLLQEFGSLDNLLRHLSQVKPARIAHSLEESRDQVRLNRELVQLDSGIRIDVDWDALKVGKPDTGALSRLFRKFEFKRLLREIIPKEPSCSGALEPRDDVSVGRLLKESGADGIILMPSGQPDTLNAAFGEEFFSFRADKRCARALLASPAIRKIGHDLKSLSLRFAIEGIVFDTMIAAYVLNPAQGSYALEDLAAEYLARPCAGAEDPGSVKIVRRLAEVLTGRLNQAGLWKLFAEVEMPLVGVLSAMEREGIRLDASVLKTLSRDIEKRLCGIRARIYKVAGCEFNINSPKQLREVLFVRLKLPVVKRTKTGPSTNEEVLRRLAGEHELPSHLVEYRQLTKLKTTYIDTLGGLVDENTGRIHTTFLQTGTETGRLSSRGPNLQNIPVKTDIGRQIRRAFVARDEEHELICADYSQIELRILAHLSRDEELIKAFCGGRDIHRATAALIAGVGESDVSGQMRDTAKRINFGIIYGLSAYGLSRDLRISVQEAQQFIDAYFLRYPGVQRFINEQVARAEEQGYVTTMLGRRRLIPEIRSRNTAIRQFAERQAVNTPVQGSAADLIKLAMLEVQRRIGRGRKRTCMVLQVHDELVFDSPREERKQVIPLIRSTMENVLALAVPVEVDIKAGSNWLEMTQL
ncbi:MAG: DNA polymerase I [Candidatus Omnitrophica bacterium]|nr:DNA polymerase I [Candidatus Omnitrophota bacterium]